MRKCKVLLFKSHFKQQVTNVQNSLPQYKGVLGNMKKDGQFRVPAYLFSNYRFGMKRVGTEFIIMPEAVSQPLGELWTSALFKMVIQWFLFWRRGTVLCLLTLDHWVWSHMVIPVTTLLIYGCEGHRHTCLAPLKWLWSLGVVLFGVDISIPHWCSKPQDFRHPCPLPSSLPWASPQGTWNLSNNLLQIFWFSSHQVFTGWENTVPALASVGILLVFVLGGCWKLIVGGVWMILAVNCASWLLRFSEPHFNHSFGSFHVSVTALHSD